MYVLFVSLVIGAQLIIRFGSDQYVLRETSNSVTIHGIYSPEPIKSAVSFTLTNYFLLLAACVVAYVVFSDSLAQREKALLVGALLFAPIFTITSLYAPYQRAKDRSEFGPIWEQSGISLITLIVLLLGTRIWELALWSTISVFVAVTLLLAIYPVILRTSKRESWGSVCRKSRHFGLQQLSQYASTTLMLVVCGLFFSEEALANLSTAQRLSLLISFPLIVMNAVVAPKFAILFASNQLSELKLYAWRTSETAAIIAVVVVFPLIFFGNSILRNVFGEPFTAAAFDLTLLALAQFFNVVTGSSLTLLNMSGYSRVSMRIALCSAFFAIVCIIISLVLNEVALLGPILAGSIVLSNTLAMISCKRVLGFYPSIPFLWRLMKDV